MKKLFAIILFTLLLVNFVSCTGNSEDKFIGTWESKIEDDGKLYASMTYSFYKSGEEYKGRFSGGSYTSSTSGSFTYDVEGSQITFTFENGNTITETYSISGNTLIIDDMEFIKN